MSWLKHIETISQKPELLATRHAEACVMCMNVYHILNHLNISWSKCVTQYAWLRGKTVNQGHKARATKVRLTKKGFRWKTYWAYCTEPSQTRLLPIQRPFSGRRCGPPNWRTRERCAPKVATWRCVPGRTEIQHANTRKTYKTQTKHIQNASRSYESDRKTLENHWIFKTSEN